MFIDKPEAHYPVIVIGSGPAGMTVAHELVMRHGFDRVLMIESGAMDYDADINRLSEVDATGDLPAEHFSVHSVRAFGGTSLIWGGWCAVMEPLSFELGEWPFKHETLLPFYQRAAEVLELPGDAVRKVSQPVKAGSAINYQPFYLSKPVRFGAKYADFAQSSGALSVMLETTVRRVTHEDGKVTGIIIGDNEMQSTNVSADTVVVACGGIGNPRLLLLSGLTARNQVGKGLMEHLHVGSDKVVLKGETLAATHGVQGSRVNAFALDAGALADAGLRSVSMAIGPDTDRGLAPNQADGTGQGYMEVQVEMLPDPGNVVGLGETIDANGQPRANVNFQFQSERFPALWRLAGEHMLRENLGRFTSPVEVERPAGGGHFMGTTRMGKPGESSVNEHCELHDCNSLYIAGSSVFPASGAVNPTFTIVALALKLADHIAGSVK